jgi:hypothetical protein
MSLEFPITRLSSSDSSPDSSFENSRVPLVRMLKAVDINGMEAEANIEAWEEFE